MANTKIDEAMKKILSFFNIYATSSKICGNKSQGEAEPGSSYKYFRQNGQWS